MDLTLQSQLHIILGPMFAGKSTYLINKINDLLETQTIHVGELITINNSNDSRYDINKICSHDGFKIDCKTFNNLNDAYNTLIETEAWNNIKFIFIDESQFFNDLYDFVKTTLINTNKQIYIAGLDGDFKQESFKNSKILDLIPWATTITKLNAKCYICNKIAPYTKRLTNKSNQIILVGGSETYQPVCIKHLNNN
jgi:thymidine kinase